MSDFAPLPGLNDFDYNQAIGSGFFSPNSINTSGLIANESSATQDTSILANSGYSSNMPDTTIMQDVGNETTGFTPPSSNNGTISGFINYIENNIGNFASRIGIVILGFIFIAVALDMFAGKNVIVNNIKEAIK